MTLPRKDLTVFASLGPFPPWDPDFSAVPFAVPPDRDAALQEMRHERQTHAVTEGLSMMWDGLLNGAAADVIEQHPYVAIGRLLDANWSGLPPTFIMCGANDAFRDEASALAEAFWRSGGEADLRQWAEIAHGTDVVNPGAHVARESAATKTRLVRTPRRAHPIFEDCRTGDLT